MLKVAFYFDKSRFAPGWATVELGAIRQQKPWSSFSFPNALKVVVIVDTELEKFFHQINYDFLIYR